MTIEARLEAAKRGRAGRARAIVVLALKMMVHDKPKFLGTTLGVVIAVVLASQQLGMLNGLLAKNTMIVDESGADLWLVPPGTTLVQPGQRMPTQVLYAARSVDGVADASPLVMTSSAVALPAGGSESITLVGFDVDTRLGGPWNVVAGDVAELRRPGSLFFEESRRARMGGLNLGSIREVQGTRVHVVGFTWGMLPFGAPYSFGSVDTVRSLANMPQRRLNYVLVTIERGRSIAQVRRALQQRLPEVVVYTRGELHDHVVSTLLGMQLGIVFGTTTIFALAIGFVIVSLTLFSSILDNLRELATLKALGMSNRELTALVLAQAIGYAWIGSFIGVGLTPYIVSLIRSPNLAVLVTPWMIAVTPPLMMLLCAGASMLALRRVRRLDPASVFR